MTGILDSISNLLASIFDVFASLFNTLLSSVQGAFAVARTLVANVADLAKGLFGLILGASISLSPFQLSCLLPEGWQGDAVSRVRRGIYPDRRATLLRSCLYCRRQSLL